MEKSSEENKKIISSFYVGYILVFSLFVAIRVITYSHSQEIDVTEFLTNDNICYEVENIIDSNNLFLMGYAYWYGDIEREMHFAVVLEDAETDKVYELPTIVREREDREEKYSPISHFGFLARINKKQLDLDHTKYRICFIDKLSKNSGVLAHTHEYIGGE